MSDILNSKKTPDENTNSSESATFGDNKNFVDFDLENTSTHSSKSKSTEAAAASTKKSWSIGRKISFTIILLCVGFLLVGGAFVWTGSASLNDMFAGGAGFDFGQLLTGKRAELQGEKDGRTNILFIGRDEEANLADTLIVGSYYHDQQKMATISLPRDFLINDGYSTTKINSVYAYAQQRYDLGQSEATPEQFMTDVVSKELDIPIHYWASVNFDGVEQVVDVLGGITVPVENSFTDCQYPNKSYGFIRPCPQFIAGQTSMNGAKALIFARSRKSFDNPTEALDFARSRRQQLVIQGIINKVKSETSAGKLALNPVKLNEYLNVVGSNVRTSINPNEMLSLYEIFKEADAITDEKYRFAVDFDSGLIIEEGFGSSNLIYADGNTGGLRYAGASKLELRRIAKNLLPEMQTRSLNQTNVAIIGNLSDLTTTAQQKFINSGYAKIQFNNTFSGVLAATPTSVEKATIYIADQNLRSQFEQSLKPEFEFTIASQMPAEIAGTAYASVPIIVIVKTVQ